MKMITFFDNLSDLPLIEVFSYLSCFDAMYSFSNLNSRLRALLVERGFFRHVNFSSARYNQFQSMLSLLCLNGIQSLVIDCYASPLQLKNWPHLPNLRTLSVKGVRNSTDVFNFAQRHANTLTHLKVQSNKYSSTVGMTKDVCYPSWNLCDFTINTLNHLSTLQSLDFGNDKTIYLYDWPLKIIETRLTYLRITVITPFVLFCIMHTQPLSHTLQQLHVTMCDVGSSPHPRFPNTHVWPRMEALHTFTFMKSFNWHFSKEWLLVDSLSSSNVMPKLRRMNFCIVININDFYRMHDSPLFTDYRHVYTNYVYMVIDNREHSQLIDYVRYVNQSRRRQIISATFISECWPNSQSSRRHHLHYARKTQTRQHLFYTVPWIFNEFVQLCVPDEFISHLQVFTSSASSNINGSSRLVKLNMLDNLPSIITLLPHIIFPNQIVELHLFGCDKQISINFPNLSRLTLTDSLNSLNSLTNLTNIQSIEIILNYRYLCFGNDDWIVLRTLSTLPRLISLRIILYDMRIPPSDKNCQIIAETVPIVSDLAFCFRRCDGLIDYNIDDVYMKHFLFIERLKNHILALPLYEQPCVVLEEDGHGIIIWF